MSQSSATPASQPAKRAKNPYQDTLNLPQTDFPMRAGLPRQEPLWVEKWLQEDIYGKLRAKRTTEKADKFIVHLGPPYANGNMHMGHALTYVLKDFVVRHNFMAGRDAPYVPGWDSHGLPIEWKVEEGIRKGGQSRHDYSVAEIRAKCRDFAEHWIGVQKSEWQRFGALGDWENPYKTMSPHAEATIVKEFHQLVKNGLVYKGVKSVMWSTVEETALAEAEVEYADKESTAIYVAFPLNKGFKEDHDYGEVTDKGHNPSVVIWTTTPWTMPANRAVAYHEEVDYVLLDTDRGAYWVAKDLLTDFQEKTDLAGTIVQREKGSYFAKAEAQHPFYLRRNVPLLPAEHVTTDAGTGFVHTAPAHGADDFELGKQFNLNCHCGVKGNGVYDECVGMLSLTGQALAGVHINKAEALIIAEMQASGALLKDYKITHSYPVSWRSKAKLIFRTTPQWFMGLDIPCDHLGGETVRQRCLNLIYGTNGQRGVEWVPESGQNRIGEMIKNRPDWCLSRQRAWGVPLCIFLDPATGQAVAEPEVLDFTQALVAKHGMDIWETWPNEDLVPEAFADAAKKWEKQTDILDVWFDSGTSHSHVLRNDWRDGRHERHDGKRPADVYQEGSDQHRGWFHSSLLTSVANYGDAPYEKVVTSGFVVDGHGRKFSKSLGNGTTPKELLDTYGMDIIRLWVASADYSQDVRYSEEAMKSAADMYRKIRLTFRFLLGNLNGFDADKHTVAVADMPLLEQYTLKKLDDATHSAFEAFENFQFSKGLHGLFDLMNGYLSSVYFDVRKDVLYCDAEDTPRRRACQTVLWHTLKALTTHLAPIMPFTTEEAYRGYFGESVHVQTYAWEPTAKGLGGMPEVETILHEFRPAVNTAMESKRSEGEIGHNYEAHVTIALAKEHQSLDLSPALIAELCSVSSVNIVTADEAAIAVLVKKHQGHKCPRCWQYFDALDAKKGVCSRCAEAV